MQCIERKNSKGTVYLFRETYRDKQGKRVVVSTTKKHNSRQAYREAKEELDKKWELKKQKALKAPKAVQNLDTLTLRQVLTEWAASEKPKVKPQTDQLHGYHIKKIFTIVSPELRFADFTVADAEQVINTVYYAEKKSFGYATTLLGTIKNGMRYARKRGYIRDISDFLEISIKRRPATMDEVQKKQNKFLTHEELADCLRQLKEKNERVGLAMEFLSLTGLRIGELQALKVEDIDLVKKAIHVRATLVESASVNSEAYRGVPKTLSSCRTVAISQRAVEILAWFIVQNKKQAAWFKGYKDKGYIFTGRNGNPLCYRTIRMVLGAVKIPGKKITSHIFRHTHASFLAEQGLNIKVIASRLGHGNVKTTLGVYTHITEAMKKEERDCVEKMKAQ